MKLTLGHSPDPDDAFMFYALAKHLLPTPGYEFEHILQDIQTLNERATRAELDITAISIHAYAYVLKDYALLRSGASMGDNYGPMIVGKKKFTREELLTRKIAVPGLMTSAFLALQLYLGVPKEKLNFVVVPFDQIFDALARGEADAGLIIHEGQLTYAGEGLRAQRRSRSVVVHGDRWPAVAARRQRGEEIARREKPSPSFPRFFTPASSTAWIIARRASSTRCRSGADSTAHWPTNSSACMSTNSRSITASGVKRAFVSFSTAPTTPG